MTNLVEIYMDLLITVNLPGKVFFLKMKYRLLFVAVLAFLIGCGFIAPRIDAVSQDESKTIPEWSIMWGDGPGTVEELIKGSSSLNWLNVSDRKFFPEKPKNISTAWAKAQLPTILPDHYGVFINEIFAKHLWVYLEDQLIQEVNYNYAYDVHRILIPLSSEDAGKNIYLKMETSKDRLGVHSDIKMDQYTKLMQIFVVSDLANIILGCAFLFIAGIMLICSIFLKKIQLASWISLSIMILTIGIIIATFSPFMFTNFERYGVIFIALFDISLAIFLPALSFFFEKVFENDKLTLMRRFRKFQMIYSVFSILCMIINLASDYRFAKVYFLISVTVLGYIILIQLVLLIGYSAIFAKRGNKDAIIFSSGFALMALMGIIDLVWYYSSSQTYQVFLWKWGIVGFIISLIVILGRRFAAYQDLMLNYSKELEFYNQQLQLSEKMEMISSLAASVAHEVRNPLQVTRGFLQLVAKSATDKNKEYMGIAIEELDRASNIITDFLTFAKPQLDEITELNIYKELKQIEGIILPLATLHGGGVSLNIPQELYIQGNSSKLKQAFINIIKNSIEAFRDEGQIHIWAYEESDQVFIHIKDNGEGIEPSKIAKLGEPYFSTKTKGTGLGLMVTFRIIEVMKGSIVFKSQKNIGTEVIIRFPTLNTHASK
ncbi:HAMP domain-containing histidine kinase [Paenibacillus sp. SYP-B3998]|uniref:histidine kinase n=1 Tax=Paenibacillus sp. SYP-B3998 TaxID=2678564 RepID=A0A6G4A0F7_9BACL|nr:HAMP domain-containing sensor histidine kinase [Paenibacillus sp. SYP-B3998]NEW07855.1 HAMP domain-containing histidine kinase [Paenibacillus sp. SYP-B3998]